MCSACRLRRDAELTGVIADYGERWSGGSRAAPEDGGLPTQASRPASEFPTIGHPESHAAGSSDAVCLLGGRLDNAS